MTPDLADVLHEIRALREDVARLENDQILTERDAAELRGLTVHTLRRERFEGRGPAYVKDPTTGAVRYQRGELRAYASANVAKPRRANEPDFHAIEGGRK